MRRILKQQPSLVVNQFFHRLEVPCFLKCAHAWRNKIFTSASSKERKRLVEFCRIVLRHILPYVSHDEVLFYFILILTLVMANVSKTVWRTIQRVLDRARKAHLKLLARLPWITQHEVLFPRINCVNNKMREFHYWNIYQRKCTKLLLHYLTVSKAIIFLTSFGEIGTWRSDWFWLVITGYVIRFHWLVSFASWFSLAV